VHRDNGRTLYSRADLHKAHGISVPTLQNLWTDRENNGHPPAETVSGVMHWDEAVWVPWHREYLRARAAAATTNTPDLSGDPEDLLGPTEAAKVCGFASSDTISGYMKNPPEGWPAPDDWDRLPTRDRPKWKRWKLWAYVADRPGRGHAGGRPRGRKAVAFPYQGDPRLELARTAIADNPGAKNSELITALLPTTERSYSRAVWNLILNSARENPEG